jgi:neural Wiskott-Aldrich syndrome protein
MPSILSDDDKETVKRHVPKASNKIQAVAVARLYVAYPNRNRWTYTGLQGAAVLANDLVGNTYWLKLVDVSVRWPPHHHLRDGILTSDSLLDEG